MLYFIYFEKATLITDNNNYAIFTVGKVHKLLITLTTVQSNVPVSNESEQTHVIQRPSTEAAVELVNFVIYTSVFLL